MNDLSSSTAGRSLGRIALFVDVQNIFYTVKQSFGCYFNYAALWSEIAGRGEIVIANAYAIDRSDARQMQFQQRLRDIGFEVMLKPFIQRADGSAKGDWDVGITLDVLESASSVDSVVLVSGDGDFDLLLERIHRLYGVKTLVYGAAALTAASLVKAADEFVPISDHHVLKTR